MCPLVEIKLETGFKCKKKTFSSCCTWFSFSPFHLLSVSSLPFSHLTIVYSFSFFYLFIQVFFYLRRYFVSFILLVFYSSFTLFFFILVFVNSPMYIIHLTSSINNWFCLLDKIINERIYKNLIIKGIREQTANANFCY